jgi:hypothetical protein
VSFCRAAVALILGSCVLAIAFSVAMTMDVASIKLVAEDNELQPLNSSSTTKKMLRNYELIRKGANAFLFREYYYMGMFVIGFSLILVVVLGELRTPSGKRTTGERAVFSLRPRSGRSLCSVNPLPLFALPSSRTR